MWKCTFALVNVETDQTTSVSCIRNLINNNKPNKI